MRIAASSDRRDSFMMPKSKFQTETLERQLPRVRLLMDSKTFKKEYSKGKSDDRCNLNAITQSISPSPRNEHHRKSKFLQNPLENSAVFRTPLENSALFETPLENSALNYFIAPVQEASECSSQG
jgi:hypothetical protein